MHTHTHIAHTCYGKQGTGDCKIIGNPATDFKGFLYHFTTQKSVEIRCSIPNYFANRSKPKTFLDQCTPRCPTGTVAMCIGNIQNIVTPLSDKNTLKSASSSPWNAHMSGTNLGSFFFEFF